MKKTVILSSALTLILGISGCGIKMKKFDKSMATASPEPLELVGDNVPAVINLRFPENWFPPKAILKVTPVIRYAGGEKRGAAYTFQGENVQENNPTVSYKEGGNVNMHFSVPYDSRMQKSTLFLTFDALNNGNKVNMPEVNIGSGVLSTSQLATAASASAVFAPDEFQRIVKDSYDADIMFEIQRADVSDSKLKDEAVEEWRDIVENAKETPNQDVSVEIQAYASPDGGVKLNRGLSETREKNTKKAITKDLKKANIDDVAIDSRYTAQDWDGFRKLVENSDIQDKELIIRILEMYPNSEQREEQIKNLSSVFSKLADDILPRLRRSRLIANVTTIGKSDEEILGWLDSHPGMLSLEELLYAAKLQVNDTQKEVTYNIIKKIYPKDYRAYNNLGALAWNRGDKKLAKQWFTMASEKKTNPYSSVNSGLMAIDAGDMPKAESDIAVGSNLTDAGHILGLLYLKKGQYAEAQKYFGDSKSNNAAVAQILNTDYAAAINTLKNIKNPNAETYYLLSIVSARTNDKTEMYKNLREAISQKQSLKYRAKIDMEFNKYTNEAEFVSLTK